MQQAFKTLMGQMPQGNSQFSNAAFSPGSPFPFPTSSTSAPAASSPPPCASQPVVTVDVSATKVEASAVTEARDDTETRKEPMEPKSFGIYSDFFFSFLSNQISFSFSFFLFKLFHFRLS